MDDRLLAGVIFGACIGGILLIKGVIPAQKIADWILHQLGVI